MNREDREFLYPRNPPRMRIVRAMQAENSVRAYRESPEGVCVQIRLSGRYATVSLSFDEAREFARRILVAVGPFDVA